MRAVGTHEGRCLYPVPSRIETCRGLGLGADRIDAAIRAAALGQRHDAVVDMLRHEIDCLCARLSGKGETLRHSVDRKNSTCAEQESAADCELPDRSAP